MDVGFSKQTALKLIGKSRADIRHLSLLTLGQETTSVYITIDGKKKTMTETLEDVNKLSKKLENLATDNKSCGQAVFKIGNQLIKITDSLENKIKECTHPNEHNNRILSL